MYFRTVSILELYLRESQWEIKCSDLSDVAILIIEYFQRMDFFHFL